MNFMVFLKNIDADFSQNKIVQKSYFLKLSALARKIVKELLSDSSLKTKNGIASQYDKLKKSIKYYNAEHPIFKYLRLPRSFWDARNIENNSKTLEKNDNKILLNESEILFLLEKLLKSSVVEHQFIGILLASGRRFSEAFQGSFEKISGKENEVLFSGQLKKKSKEPYESFEIPLLISAENFLFLHENFLKNFEKKASDALSSNPIPQARYTFERSMNKKMNDIMKVLFPENSFSVHDLRSMYATICANKQGLFEKDSQGEVMNYVGKILGHEIEKSLSSTFSYRDFGMTEKKVFNFLTLEGLLEKNGEKIKDQRDLLINKLDEYEQSIHLSKRFIEQRLCFLLKKILNESADFSKIRVQLRDNYLKEFNSRVKEITLKTFLQDLGILQEDSVISKTIKESKKQEELESKEIKMKEISLLIFEGENNKMDDKERRVYSLLLSKLQESPKSIGMINSDLVKEWYEKNFTQKISLQKLNGIFKNFREKKEKVFGV